MTFFENMVVPIKKLHPDAEYPKYATTGSVAFDLQSIEDYVIRADGGQTFIETGLAFAVPCGYEMQIRQRSGLSIKYPNYIVIGIGTIDQDYRGEIKIPVRNNSNTLWIIKKGDRIAQAVISPISKAHFRAVDELDETKRGDGGFGHTG